MPSPTAVSKELVGCGVLHVPCPTAVYEGLLEVTRSVAVVEVCLESEDDKENDALETMY